VTARRILLVVGGAIALLFAWCALPASRAAQPDSKTARPAASGATARPTAVTGAPPHHVQPPASTLTTTAAKTGIPACDRFVERTMNCAQLPDDAKIAIAEASKAWAELTAAGPQPDLEASCRATASVQGESLAAMGC
jgi:hypothetical protein